VPLPDGLATIVLTGTYLAADGSPLGGQVSFTPSSVLSDATGQVIISGTAVAVRLGPAGSFSISLPCTDDGGLAPSGWQWHARVDVTGAETAFWFEFPSSLAPAADMTEITPLPVAPEPLFEYVSYVNGHSGNVDLTLADLAPLVVGGGVTLATSATSGFLYLASCAGVPTGTPAAQGSAVPLVIDTVHSQIWAYISGSWKALTLS
jgi:hypothetical protein